MFQIFISAIWLIFIPLKAFSLSDETLMAEIALKQAEFPDAAWSKDQRDCAGFIRYVYLRTFKAKLPLWLDSNGQRTWFLRAEDLIAYNFSKVSSKDLSFPPNAFDTSYLKTGDVIVFYNPYKDPQDAWHLMLLIFPTNQPKSIPLIVYHNGLQGPQAAIRKLWWHQLFAPSFQQWSPHPANPYFRGIYRWKRHITST